MGFSAYIDGTLTIEYTKNVKTTQKQTTKIKEDLDNNKVEGRERYLYIVG